MDYGSLLITSVFTNRDKKVTVRETTDRIIRSVCRGLGQNRSVYRSRIAGRLLACIAELPPGEGRVLRRYAESQGIYLSEEVRWQALETGGAFRSGEDCRCPVEGH